MDQESSSGPRKSGRVRQKRNFGDDFVDPDSIQQSEYTAKIRTGKSNNDNPSPTASSNEEAIDDVVEEDDEEKYPTEPPETPVTSSSTSSLLKHIADTVSDGILKDIKEEIREKEEMRMKQAADMKIRIEKNYLSGTPEKSTTTNRNQWNRNGLPVNIAPKRSSGGGIEGFGALDPGDKLEYLVVDEERQLEEAAAANLAAIREANVRKILAKRSSRRDNSSLTQMAAQDAEINNYLNRNQDFSVLNQLPTTSGSTGSRGPKFVRLSDRSIVVPPQQEIQKPMALPIPQRVPAFQKFNLAGVPPNVNVGQFLRQQMAAATNNRPSAVRRINVNQIQPSRLRAAPEESPPKPKIVRKIPVGTPLPPPFSAASKPSNNVIYKANPVDTAGPLPPYVPQGKQVAKILIKRGPNGELIPQGRVMIRTPEQGSQFRPRLQPSQTHPGSLADIQPLSQPDFLDVKLEEKSEDGGKEIKLENVDDYEPPVKQLKEVKDEPIEEEAGPSLRGIAFPNRMNTSTVVDPNLPVGVYLASQQQRLQPPPRRIIKPRGSKTVFPHGSVTSLYDMVVHGNPNVTTPHRIFLGAEEPMKDMMPEQYGRFSIRKVKSLNLDKFKWKSPVNGSALQQVTMEPRKLQKFQSEGDALDSILNQKKQQKIPEEDLQIRKKKVEEFYRQKQALAQKMTMNEGQIWEYMQSEEFKKSITPGKSASKFEQLLSRPNAFAEISEFSDSLSHTNPELFANLVRIFRMKNGGGTRKFKVSDEVRSVHDIQSTSTAVFQPPQPPKPPQEPPLPHPEAPVRNPVDDFEDLEEWQEEEQLQNILDTVPQYVEVEWFGVKANVPELVPCHLCSYAMRLCMRKTKYRGEYRNYPAYRCLAKGCQTFRSMKKQFRDTIRAGRPYGPGPTDEPSTCPRLELSKEPHVVGRCEESLGEQTIKEEDEEPKEIKLEPEPDVEDEEEETVDFEYLTNNPMFDREGSDEPEALSEYDEAEADEMEVEYECPFDDE
ncbi:hypothetical protein CAEBREN_19723 [Caenorhabditis brenneri]|uniref:Uncharacterized protein n=1 Tax=Caenorhabditis brenneri TaxID=135651 RepID=G0P5Q9_CAEBE|nr:hypothetical protein CAEBREN_19723 [Caenorhabditis brenneri]